MTKMVITSGYTWLIPLKSVNLAPGMSRQHPSASVSQKRSLFWNPCNDSISKRWRGSVTWKYSRELCRVTIAVPWLLKSSKHFDRMLVMVIYARFLVDVKQQLWRCEDFEERVAQPYQDGTHLGTLILWLASSTNGLGPWSTTTSHHCTVILATLRHQPSITTSHGERSCTFAGFHQLILKWCSLASQPPGSRILWSQRASGSWFSKPWKIT